MTLLLRLLAGITLERTAVLATIATLSWVHPARSVDIWTVGIDNTRQGWNKFETILKPANVPGLRKTREFIVDEKIDVTPLVVGNKLYVFTMTNTAFIFDVNTGAQIARRQLAPPFDPADIANPRGPNCCGMDKWNIYRNWGITATPVIDVATNTIYATTFGKPAADSSNQERINMLWVLNADTLDNRQEPVLIEGEADNGGGGIANRFAVPYQKMRAGLGLLTEPGGNKAVVISFSMNGENPRGPGHGFVVAYDVRGLHRQAGFAPRPAIWNVTPGGGAGGVWMSGSGPAIDGNDIYLATGNGMDPGKARAENLPDSFAESFVKLRYTAGTPNANDGKPTLAVADFWNAFSDFGRADEDQDLGAAGIVLVPERGNLIGGGKDGILYNLNKNNLGQTSWNPHFNLPFVATYLPNLPNNKAGLATNAAVDPQWPIVDLDRNTPARTPNGKSFHIHGTPVYMETATGGIVYLWGENERLKAYNLDFATKRITGFRAQGAQFASGANMPAPGGMPGGRLVVSSNGTAKDTGVVWAVYPTDGDANAGSRPGALVAYDATTIIGGNQMRQLFHSGNNANKLGNFAKYSTPVVANGKVYVGTFGTPGPDGQLIYKVVQYGL